MLSDITKRLKATASNDHVAIKIRESKEPLVGIGNAIRSLPFWLDDSSLIQSVEGKFYKPYIRQHPSFNLQVRQGVLDRLIEAEQYLPSGWKIILQAGFRPAQVQNDMFNDYLQEIIAEHEDWSMEECLIHAEQYISNPKRMVPPHVTGGAVDVEIYDSNSDSMVDMGGKMCELSERSHCLNKLLTSQQYDNQNRLIKAMCHAGFAPFATEWWHFSYGDQRWASFYAKDFAIYGEAQE